MAFYQFVGVLRKYSMYNEESDKWSLKPTDKKLKSNSSGSINVESTEPHNSLESQNDSKDHAKTNTLKAENIQAREQDQITNSIFAIE